MSLSLLPPKVQWVGCSSRGNKRMLMHGVMGSGVPINTLYLSQLQFNLMMGSQHIMYELLCYAWCPDHALYRNTLSNVL